MLLTTSGTHQEGQMNRKQRRYEAKMESKRIRDLAQTKIWTNKLKSQLIKEFRPDPSSWRLFGLPIILDDDDNFQVRLNSNQ